MSELGHTRTSADVYATASPQKADMPGSPSDVAEGPERDHVRLARATPAADVSVALTVDNGRGFNIPLTKDMWVAGDQASNHDKSDRPWAPGKVPASGIAP
jgi:hypothetical protein